MKILPKAADNFIRKPSPECRAVLFYGPDEGLTHERGKQLVISLLGEKPDSMNITELKEERLKDDPAMLHDELFALGLLGTSAQRVIIVRNASDKLSATLKEIYEGGKPEAFLLLLSDDLSTTSSLRKLAEARDEFAAIACYHDEGRSLEAIIREKLQAAGIDAAPGVVAFLAAHAGNDRQVTLQEIQKIIIYQGDNRNLSLEAAMLLSGQNDFYTLDDLCMATLGGKTADMASYLQRTLGEGQHPVMIARALQRHLMRLLQARGFMDDGQNIDAAMAQLRPPVFFKYVPVFKAVLQRWSARDINAGLKAMLEAELQFKSSLADVGLLCRHQLLALSSLPGSAARAA